MNSQADIWEKSFPGRGTPKYKGSAEGKRWQDRGTASVLEWCEPVE